MAAHACLKDKKLRSLFSCDGSITITLLHTPFCTRIEANFHVTCSYQNLVKSREKCIPNIGKYIFKDNLGSNKTILLQLYQIIIINSDYRYDPKFSDIYAWTNSADPDQTAPRGAV